MQCYAIEVKGLSMKNECRKSNTITIRCTEKEKSILQKKAKAQGKSVSEYLVDNGIAGAERRSSREKRRIGKLVENQELLNQLFDCIDRKASREEMREIFQKILEGEQRLWDC